ncbi:dipeptide epimerase [bacterium]|nr:dipeptide epimerase [bacterium]
MAISRIELYKLNIPLKNPFIISLGVMTDVKNIVVKIHTDQDGLYGTGEACPFWIITGSTQESDFELAKILARVMIGKNPLEIEHLIREMDEEVKFNPTIKGAFDMALYDILGKYTQLPLYALWGGKNDRTLTTDMTVSLDTPEKMATEALAFKDNGFPAIKVKLGENTIKDVARIKAIREAIGMEIPLRIDANQGWDVVTAIHTLKALEKFDIEHCEEPVPRWNNEGLVLVRSKSPIPVMADESLFDEHDAFRLASMGACDYFNIKLSKSGGLNTALKIVAVADAAGIKSQVGCMLETRLGLTALAHLVVARKNIVHYDLDSALMHAEDPVSGGMRYLEKGEVAIPDSPGIGADFDPQYLASMDKVMIG